MDNFFHNLNKKMADLAQRQDLAESAVTERDQGKHNNATTGFKALAKKAGKEYGSKAAGERVAGAQFQKMKRAGKLEEGQCSACNCSPCSCNEGNAFSGAVAKAKSNGIQKGEKIRVGGKTYPVKEADPMGMEEGAFKNLDIERQEREMKKSRHNPGNSPLRQVPGVQNLKPKSKEHPLKNVARGVKAFVQGKPEPMDEEKESRSKGTAFDPDTRKQMKTDKEGTGNFDKKKVSTGTVYTRRHKEDDEEVTSNEPKRKGRPKGPAKGPERVTAKSYKYKQGRPVKENGIAITDRGEYDQEGDEVKGDMHTVIRHAQELEQHLQNGENLPTWVIEKVGQIKGMMTSISDYMLSQHERGTEQATGQEGIRIAEDVTVSTGAIQELWKLATFLKGYIRDPEGMAAWQEMAQLIKGYKDSQQQNVAERSKSQTQARMMAGAAHNPKFAKKVGVATKVAKEFNKADTGKDISRLPKKVKKTDEGNDGNLANNAKPYDKVTRGDVVAGRLGKDEMGGKKPKEKKVDETTTSGSVAPVANAAPKGKGGMTFGKGVYEGAVNESYERKLKAVLNEGMNVTVNMNGQGQKSVNVSADGEDAEKLAEILKLAGLGGQSGGCSSCGQSSCGCETVDEAYGDTTATKNNPDWPTDTETTDDNDPYLRRFSGGLNGAKSTGQTTVPVVASQARRQVSMEENVKLERSLFNTWKTYKGQ